MVIGITLFIVSVLIIAIWVIIEIKRLKHKLFAIFLISLILLAYLSFVFVFREQQINLNTVSGIMEATKLYFSWLGSIFGNMKTITSHAVKMDWSPDESIDSDSKILSKTKKENRLFSNLSLIK